MNSTFPFSIADLPGRFAKVKALVVGDLMLDQYWWGSVERMSPEAPVPVVRLNRTSTSPGGAANVAVNIAGLGANAVLVGVIGKDEEGKRLVEVLELKDVKTDHLLRVERPTSVKTRVVAHNQHVVRVDRETSEFLVENDEESIIQSIRSAIKDCSVVILSDYAKGTLSEKLISATVEMAKTLRIPILADPKGKDFSKYKGMSMITPNKREAALACHLEEEEKNVVSAAGAMLLAELGLDGVVITEGEHGMTLMENGHDPIRIKAEAHEVFDVTGAGDTVIAALAVGVASGFTYLESMQIANISAGLVVEQVGTTAISIEHLLHKLQQVPSATTEKAGG